MTRTAFCDKLNKKEFQIDQGRTQIICVGNDATCTLYVPITATVAELKVDLFVLCCGVHNDVIDPDIIDAVNIVLHEKVVLRCATTVSDWRAAIQKAYRQVWWCVIIGKSKTTLTSRVLGNLTGKPDRISDNIERGLNALFKANGYRSRVQLTGRDVCIY